jgi:phage tail-like protein
MAEFIAGTEFEVRFDLIKASFSKITNIGSKIEYDTFIEGGQNDCPLYLKKPKTKPDTIIFEKGIHTSITSNIFGIIKEGMKVKNVMIFVKHNGKTDRILYFDSGLVLSKEFSVMDAMSNSVLIEKMEIAHSGLKEMPVLF